METENFENLLKEAEKYLPLFILQIEDEDLERLEKELGRKQAEKVLLIMMVTPKKDWKERGSS